MKELLVEHTSAKDARLTICESKEPGARMRVKGKLQEVDVKNGNGRVYPKDTLMREVEKFIAGPIHENRAAGELDHPATEIVNLSNVSHNIKRIWWEGDNLMGELEILNTPAGRIAQEIILAGIPLGISSRAVGSVKQLGETVEVQDDLSLITWDLVSTPSTPGAYLHLAEGKVSNNDQNDKLAKINELITEILCNRGGFCPCEIN